MNGNKRVQQENVWGKRTGDGKKAGENGLLWGRGGMDVMALWGMCFQGAERPQSGDMGVRSRGRRTKSATAKKTTGSETNPSPPLPPLFLTETQSPLNPFYQKSC